MEALTPRLAMTAWYTWFYRHTERQCLPWRLHNVTYLSPELLARMPCQLDRSSVLSQKKSTCTQEPAPQARACIGLQNDDWAPAMILGGKLCAPPAQPVDLNIGRVKRSEKFRALAVTYHLQQRNTHVTFANTGLHSCVVPVGHSKAYHGDSGVKSIEGVGRTHTDGLQFSVVQRDWLGHKPARGTRQEQVRSRDMRSSWHEMTRVGSCNGRQRHQELH